MATMYCALCRRPVEARRQVGVGTAILAVFTAGLSLLAIPFYSPRCSICKSAAVSATELDGRAAGRAPAHAIAALEQRLAATSGELESAQAEIRRLSEERDFYRQLLDDPTRRGEERTARGTGD